MNKLKLQLIIAIIFLTIPLYPQANIDGFGSLKWGVTIEEAKGGVVGKITYTDEKKVLVSRDGDIEYIYGFFYKGQDSAEPEAAAAEAAQADAEKIKESRLFYVSVKFPYLAKDEVKKKIEEKYGPATGEDMRNNKGAIIWDSENSVIIMWVDNYENKPYCMKINYYSKAISREVNDYQAIIFNSNEIEILKRLSP